MELTSFRERDIEKQTRKIDKMKEGARKREGRDRPTERRREADKGSMRMRRRERDRWEEENYKKREIYSTG